MTDTTEASNEEINGDNRTATTEQVNDVPESEIGKDEAVVVVVDDPKENVEVHEPRVDADEKKDDEPVADADEKKDDYDESIAEVDEKKDYDEPPTATNSESAQAAHDAPVSDAPESTPAATDSNTAEEATDNSPLDGVENTPENQVSTPVSSPARPSSLSSTPERPSSLSSTPERASFQQQQQQLPSSTFEVQDDDTWSQITKRDRPLSNANAIAVMDHAHTVLEKRISDATDDRNMKDNLRIFQQSLGRFQNSEIKLGRRCVI